MVVIPRSLRHRGLLIGPEVLTHLTHQHMCLQTRNATMKALVKLFTPAKENAFIIENFTAVLPNSLNKLM